MRWKKFQIFAHTPPAPPEPQCLRSSVSSHRIKNQALQIDRSTTDLSGKIGQIQRWTCLHAPPRFLAARSAQHALASILSMLMSALSRYSLLLTSADPKKKKKKKKKSFYFPFYAFYFICNIQKKKKSNFEFQNSKIQKFKKKKNERKLALTNKKKKNSNFKFQNSKKKKCGIYFFYSIFMSRDRATKLRSRAKTISRSEP
jgi:hypothetical protein